MLKNDSLKLQLSKNSVLMVLFLMVFVQAPFYKLLSVLTAVFRISGIYIYSIVFYGLLIVYLFLNSFRKIGRVIVCYGIVFLLIGLTLIKHPDYSFWLSGKHIYIYGFFYQFVSGRAAILSFAVVSFSDDNDTLYRNIRCAAWLFFIYYSFSFIQFLRVGYWSLYDFETLGIKEASYNLEFGYYLLFPAAYFGISAFVKRQRLYYIPYLLSIGMILFGGSRGPVVWCVALFVIFIPFRWKLLKSQEKFIFGFFIVLLLGCALFVYQYYDVLIDKLYSLISSLGIESRTLTSLIEGSFSDANGRDEIYSMAIDMIKKGGLFGYGVYGDRIVIGEYFRWGYCHNIFLEFFVSFGYLGGAFCSLSFIGICIGLYRRCKTPEEMLIFGTLFISSMKLMTSNSFWYTQSFWALIALYFLWRGKKKRRIMVFEENTDDALLQQNTIC